MHDVRYIADFVHINKVLRMVALKSDNSSASESVSPTEFKCKLDRIIIGRKVYFKYPETASGSIYQ